MVPTQPVSSQNHSAQPWPLPVPRKVFGPWDWGYPSTLEHAWPTRGYPTFWPLRVVSLCCPDSTTSNPPTSSLCPELLVKRSFCSKRCSGFWKCYLSIAYYGIFLMRIYTLNILNLPTTRRRQKVFIFHPLFGSYSHLYFSKLKKLKILAEEHIWNVTFINLVSSTS